MKHIVFVSDVWLGANVSGVVTWLVNIKRQLEKRGFRVSIIHPADFLSLPLPTYPEIRLSLFARKKVKDMLRQALPDYIHISTEGPLGLAARRICLKNKWRFTTYYHTRLPEYVQVRLKTGKKAIYAYLRWFHHASTCIMVGTPSMKAELEQKGFGHIAVVSHGIDLQLFRRNPNARAPEGLRQPIFAYLGRIAPEKNIEAFLKCDLPGSKLIIGDGPSKSKLENKYENTAYFAGFKKGQELVDLLSAADVFVFPSKTDTFGLTIVEALACGLPIAAYDVTGPRDIITNGLDGFLGDDLENNAKKCLAIDRALCIKKAQQYSWENSANLFLHHSPLAIE